MNNTLRNQLINRRTSSIGVLCEGCNQWIRGRVEVHHLIWRSQTPTGHIRELSEVPELLSVVCEMCHLKAHDTPQFRDTLFQAKYRQYGYAKVREAFNKVRIQIRIGFELPEVIDE